jgi:hypothetical protein
MSKAIPVRCGLLGVGDMNFGMSSVPSLRLASDLALSKDDWADTVCQDQKQKSTQGQKTQTGSLSDLP